MHTCVSRFVQMYSPTGLLCSTLCSTARELIMGNRILGETGSACMNDELLELSHRVGCNSSNPVVTI